MNKPSFNIREMQPQDLPAAMDIKNREGWNQTLTDWEFLLHDKNNCCLVALHQDKVVATVSAINYEHRLSWIGMMLVRQEYRGLGLAKTLMKAMLEKLQGYQAIKLDATPAGFPVYAGLGFVTEYRIWRMTRPASVQPPAPATHIAPLMEASLEGMVDYDQKNYGVNRKQLLEYLYRQSPESAWIAQTEQSIHGYILGRPGTNYHQLGPLVATSMETAIALLSSALAELKDQAVVVDVVSDKEALINWLQDQGFIQQRELIRMYYQHHPLPGNIARQFLISGPELG